MSVFDTFLNLQWIGLGSVPEFLIEFFLWLDSIIYSLVGTLMQLFLDLASVDYIFNLNRIQYIIDGVYLVVGVVVLFVVAINLLQYVINPDRDDGKSLRDIAIRVVKALVLVVLTPTMFSVLYDVQHVVISYNVVPRLLLSDEMQNTFNSSDDITINVDKTGDESGEFSNVDDSYTYTKDEVIDSVAMVTGNQLGWYIYSGFFHEDEANIGGEYDIAERLGDNHSWVGWLAGGVFAGLLFITGLPGWVALVGGGLLVLSTNDITIDTSKYTFEMLEYQILGGDWDMLTAFAPFVQDGSINYLFILSTIAGLFLVYVIFSFCLDVGIRALKLIFYQAVAPICFFMSIIPGKESTIKNWFAAVGATWLEVFVRIACILLVVVGANLIGSMELPSDSFFVKALLVISLLAFVKMLPKLFADITGLKSGNMKLGIKGKLSEVMGYKTATRIGKATLNTGKTYGKKIAAGIDAQKNGLGFSYGFKSVQSNGPLAKFRKFKATIAPYSYANEEERRKADEETRATQVRIQKGNELIDKYGSSDDYITNLKGGKYDGLKDTYAKRAAAKKNMIDWENELAAARASGDVSKISEASKNYNDAKKVYDLYDHEFNTTLGTSEFKQEKSTFDAMKYVEDRLKTVPQAPISTSSGGSASNQSGLGTTLNRGSSGNNNSNPQPTRPQRTLYRAKSLGGNKSQRNNNEISGQTSMFDKDYNPNGYEQNFREVPGQTSMFDRNFNPNGNEQNTGESQGQTSTFANNPNNSRENTQNNGQQSGNSQSTGQSNGPSNNISR